MNSSSGSPFSAAVPVHMLEENEVAQLLHDFSTAKGVELEEGITRTCTVLRLAMQALCVPAVGR